MRTINSKVPSLTALLRHQLDLVSSLSLGTITKKDLRLVDKYLSDGGELNDQDQLRAESVATTIFLFMSISKNEELVIANDTFSKLVKDHVRPSVRQYEEFYAYKSLATLTAVARRAATISSLWVTKLPSAAVIALCREAYNTYIHGFHLASVALLRSVVEARLKEALVRDILDLEKDPKFSELKTLAREKGVYSDHVFAKIDAIRKCGNRALHNTHHPTEQQNLTMIKHAQTILEYLHRHLP